ncbi:hypothetical protein CLOP_g24131 [Closterium sp. NIES-67]|nr:hypothetical protein CLOP_g24131 [Closterium sp. NIES-67]
MLLSLSVTEKARGAGSGPANCPTLVSWKEGDLILGEEGAFAGYAVRIPFTGDLTSPAIAYEWNYRFVGDNPVASLDGASRHEPVGRNQDELGGELKRQRLPVIQHLNDSRHESGLEPGNSHSGGKASWWWPWTWSKGESTTTTAAMPQQPPVPSALQTEE